MDHLLFEVWNSKVRYVSKVKYCSLIFFLPLMTTFIYLLIFFVKLTFYLPTGSCVSFPLAFLASLFSRVKFTFETCDFFYFDNSVVVLFFYSLYKTVNTRLKNIYLSFTSIFQPFDSGMVPGNFKSGCKLFLGHIFHWRSIFFSKLSTGKVGNNLHKNFKILNCSLTLGGRQGSPRDSRPRQRRWLLGQNRSPACNPEL